MVIKLAIETQAWSYATAFTLIKSGQRHFCVLAKFRQFDSTHTCNATKRLGEWTFTTKYFNKCWRDKNTTINWQRKTRMKPVSALPLQQLSGFWSPFKLLMVNRHDHNIFPFLVSNRFLPLFVSSCAFFFSSQSDFKEAKEKSRKELTYMYFAFIYLLS